jgi:hypothetical protein
VKETPGPAVTWLSLRRALAVAAAAALVTFIAGCFGGDGDEAKPPGPLPAALSYIPGDSGLVVVVPTDLERGPLHQLDRLGRRLERWRGFKQRLLRTLARAGFDRELLRDQLGNPLAFAPLASGDLVGALRVKDGTALKQAVERRIEAGHATRLDDYKGAFRWHERGGTFAAVSGADLVLAPNQKELEQALDAGEGSDSLAFDERIRATLDRLGADALVRAAGDAQRLLERDPAEAERLRKIPWIRALGAFEAVSRVDRRGAAVEFRLRSDRAPLSQQDLPLAPGAAAPIVHDSEAAATVAVLEPDRLARFLERSVSVTDPDSYGRYASAVGQLRGLFGIDIHRDLLQKAESVSVALASRRALDFEARLRKGAGAEVKRTLTRAGPAIGFALGDLLGGGTLVQRRWGWEVRRGRLVVARYAVRGDSLVGSLGRAELPRARGGRRLPNANGSLALRGDLSRIGAFLGLALDFPEQTLDVVSGLGDLTLSVRTETSGVSARGRLEVAPGQR